MQSPTTIAPFLFWSFALGACAPSLQQVEATGGGLALTTAGPNTSMIYIARTDAGVLVIDLGWTGARREIRRGLERLGADTADIAAVLLTHAHRDHTAGWRTVATAPFYMAGGEVDLFLGREQSHGWIPRTAGRLKRVDRPEVGDVRVRPFSGDTILVFGSDTVRAVIVPGHTGGSTAYLFRGVLFVGDAMANPLWSGFRPALAGYSDDAAQAARSLDHLWEKVRPFDVRYVCTAHAKCARFEEGFKRDVGTKQDQPDPRFRPAQPSP